MTLLIFAAVVGVPVSALAYGFSAQVHVQYGNYDRAIEHAERAVRLSPFDPFNYNAYLAQAFSYFMTGRFEDGVRFGKLAVQSNATLSPCHSMLVANLVESARLLAKVPASYVALGAAFLAIPLELSFERLLRARGDSYYCIEAAARRLDLRRVETVYSSDVNAADMMSFYVATHEAIRENGRRRILPIPVANSTRASFMVLHDGRIHFDGSAADLRASNDRYLREFLCLTLPPW